MPEVEKENLDKITKEEVETALPMINKEENESDTVDLGKEATKKAREFVAKNSINSEITGSSSINGDEKSIKDVVKEDQYNIDCVNVEDLSGKDLMEISMRDNDEVPLDAIKISGLSGPISKEQEARFQKTRDNLRKDGDAPRKPKALNRVGSPSTSLSDTPEQQARRGRVFASRSDEAIEELEREIKNREVLSISKDIKNVISTDIKSLNVTIQLAEQFRAILKDLSNDAKAKEYKILQEALEGKPEEDAIIMELIAEEARETAMDNKEAVIQAVNAIFVDLKDKIATELGSPIVER